jgi:tetratricopeptide (TPR) repeat protein
MGSPGQEQQAHIIGENVRKFRLQKGLTQQEAAENICSVSQWSKMEAGKVLLKETMMKAIADRLGVALTSLYSADLVLDELKEKLELARAFGVKNDQALPLVQEVIEKSKAYGYWDLFGEAAQWHATLLIWQYEHVETVNFITRLLEQDYPIPFYHKIVFKLVLCTSHKQLGNEPVAFAYCQEAESDLELGPDEIPNQVGIFIYSELSKGFRTMGEYQKAIRYASRAEELSLLQDANISRLRAMCLRANAYRFLNQFELAEELYLKALEVAQNNSMTFDIGYVNFTLGILYKYFRKSALSMQYFKRAVTIWEIGDYEKWLCGPLGHLGDLAFEDGDLKMAKEYAKRSLQIGAQMKLSMLPYDKGVALRVLGLVSRAEGDFEAFIRYFEEAAIAFGDDYAGGLGYETCVELAEALYERQDPRTLDAYRRAITFSQKIIASGRLVR